MRTGTTEVFPTVSRRSRLQRSAFAYAAAALALSFLAPTAVQSKSSVNFEAEPQKMVVNSSMAYSTSPTAQICGNPSILDGLATPPPEAVTVLAGDNSGIDFQTPGTTYWFAPGVHTLGAGQYNQVRPADNTTFIGAPGAVFDGRGINRYAFTGAASNVTIKHLTITGFMAPGDEGVVNH
ncbi:MAG TPA: hypothetical protein VGR26_09445, partial [Acidimicrobiales bacterium]|nr:hypothetical protein [Acidimicrobiales bacterium]